MFTNSRVSEVKEMCALFILVHYLNAQRCRFLIFFILFEEQELVPLVPHGPNVADDGPRDG